MVLVIVCNCYYYYLVTWLPELWHPHSKALDLLGMSEGSAGDRRWRIFSVNSYWNKVGNWTFSIPLFFAGGTHFLKHVAVWRCDAILMNFQETQSISCLGLDVFWWVYGRWSPGHTLWRAAGAIYFCCSFFFAGFGDFFGGSWFYAFLPLCFSAFLLFLLFDCFLLFMLFAFPASLLFMLLCFSALPASFLFCFSAFPASLLLCFCASVPFYFYYCILLFLFFSNVFLLLDFLLLFLSLLPLCVFFCFILSCLYPKWKPKDPRWNPKKPWRIPNKNW